MPYVYGAIFPSFFLDQISPVFSIFCLARAACQGCTRSWGAHDLNDKTRCVLIPSPDLEELVEPSQIPKSRAFKRLEFLCFLCLNPCNSTSRTVKVVQCEVSRKEAQQKNRWHVIALGHSRQQIDTVRTTIWSDLKHEKSPSHGYFRTNLWEQIF